jgi:23S rRNA maturation-related 3'-5' exoribonuclease YhaM
VLVTARLGLGVGGYKVVAIDTTQATNTNRAKLYVNGTQVTAFGTAVYPTQNTDLLVNQAIQHSIGSNLPWGGSYADCYMTEINFIDGSALTPSSFGETNETTGVWSPIRLMARGMLEQALTGST